MKIKKLKEYISLIKRLEKEKEVYIQNKDSGERYVIDKCIPINEGEELEITISKHSEQPVIFKEFKNNIYQCDDDFNIIIQLRKPENYIGKMADLNIEIDTLTNEKGHLI